METKEDTADESQVKSERSLIRKSMVFSIALLIFSLAVGIAGYHYLTHMAWDDSFLNAAMILTGMGPVHDPDDTVGKIFAGFYALYSGIVFLSIVALMIVPVFHTYLKKWKFKE